MRPALALTAGLAPVAADSTWKNHPMPASASPAASRAAVELFLNLRWSEDHRRWSQPLVPGLTGGRGGLFGGCAVGAVIAGLERATGRPLAWVTGQFLAACRPPDELTFTIDHLVEGRNVSQATVVARVGGADVLSFQAALGSRPATDGDLRSVTMPAAPSPASCPPAELPPGPGGLRPRFDGRGVPATTWSGPPGASLWWFRTDELADQGDPCLLAVILDFVPMALSAALDRPVFGASLDNTVRVVERAPTDWVLAELSLDALSNGIAHVSGRAWTADGVLLAVGSQTCIVTDRPG